MVAFTRAVSESLGEEKKWMQRALRSLRISSGIFISAPFVLVEQRKARETRATLFQVFPSKAIAPPLGLSTPSFRQGLHPLFLGRAPLPSSFSFALFCAATLSNADRLTEDSSRPKISFHLSISFHRLSEKLWLEDLFVKVTSWQGVIRAISSIRFWQLSKIHDYKQCDGNYIKWL